MIVTTPLGVVRASGRISKIPFTSKIRKKKVGIRTRRSTHRVIFYGTTKKLLTSY
ncbi:MAG: hypothetical protein FWG63_04310 [Defluviitaleaceae bacterium]|nr:hypothetical protein [Defluviitaleaceae bacterium]